ISMSNTSVMVPFPCSTYISPNKGDKQCVRELPATRPGEAPLPMKKYEIHCKTGNERFASTKANVEIMLIGERGTSGVRLLGTHNCLDKDRKVQFRKGRTARFFIEAVDLGKIKKIEVGHDGERKQDGWYLQHILVKENDGPTYFFSGDIWICKYRGDVTTCQLDRSGIFDDSDDGEDEETDDDNDYD
ncbi:lipoxygenase homology domain-containing protein 1-like, partial [Saccoglossus kowalevskii]